MNDNRRTYVIDQDLEGEWHLRRFGTSLPMHSAESVEKVREHAFVRLRQWSPCRMRILANPFEEWLLDHGGREWRQVEPDPRAEEDMDSGSRG